MTSRPQIHPETVSARPRGLPPSPWAASPLYAPDSSVVSDVVPSANYGERRGERAPDLIVLHYTGMSDAAVAMARLTTAGSEVSAHYVVYEDGRIMQLVPEAKRAWHAGASSWGGETDINSCSIGIEIVNGGHERGMPDYPLRQIAAVIALCKGILIRRSIPRHRVVGHSDIAPGRKQDPGETFPWQLLSDSGVGHFVPPERIVPGPALTIGASGDDVRAVQEALAKYGYGVAVSGQYDQATHDVVAAFQRRFRPRRIDGAADPSTIATLRALLDSRAIGHSLTV
jgi:N-acetylmuramoyl-L-alanine amidase